MDVFKKNHKTWTFIYSSVSFFFSNLKQILSYCDTVKANLFYNKQREALCHAELKYSITDIVIANIMKFEEETDWFYL